MISETVCLQKENITSTQPDIFTLTFRSLPETLSEEACSVLLPVLATTEM